MFCLVSPALAQGTLGLASGFATPGSTVSLNLSFSAGGNAPAALEWSLSYPSATVTSFQATAGPALTASSKTLSCNGGGGVLTCVAAGLNSGAIGSGVVAVLTATVSASAGGTVSIPIGNLMGANPDGTFEAVSGTGATIAISPTVPSISGLQCSPTSLVSDATSICTVTLSQAAPAGGSAVALSSSSTALPVPASVTVGAGLSSATFSATASTVSTNQTVIVSALLNGSAQTDITILPPATNNFAPILINAGGGSYTDSAGNTWSADYDFTGGYTSSTAAAIAGTTDPALYQTSRWGTLSYQIAVPNGSYSVTLKFAELHFTGTGSRLFNVSIDGTPVLTNFDIVAQAGGPLRAVDKSFPVTVTDGQISIQFAAGFADQPTVNAIEVASGSGSPPPAGGTPVFLTNSGGPAYTGSSNTWSADSDFTGGNTAFVTAPILGTADPALYQTCRWGSFSYQIPVPNGSYTVTLKFAEIYFAAAGSRLFNVSINGTPVLTNFDIVAQAGGPLQALDKSFPVIVTNGQIDIQFALGTADQPVVNAIEVLTAN